MYFYVPTLEQDDYMKQVKMHWVLSILNVQGSIFNVSLTDWLTDWMTDWLTDWMTGWLAKWLTDWLTDMCMFYADFLKNYCTYFNPSRKIFPNHVYFSARSPINYNKEQIWLERGVSSFYKNTEHI